jgi:hypothetical protein
MITAQTVEDRATVIVRIAQISADGPNGRFFDVSGSIAWRDAVPTSGFSFETPGLNSR